MMEEIKIRELDKKIKIKKMLDDGHSTRDIADALSCSLTTINNVRKDIYNIDLIDKKETKIEQKQDKQQVVSLSKSDTEKLKIIAELTPAQLKELLYFNQLNTKKDIEIGSKEIGHAIFGAIGDTHFGSKACNYEGINKFYDEMDKRGIKTVFHAGDIVDGYNVYKGHTFELSKLSLSDQIQDVVDNYPKKDGIDTYYILGNHDENRLKLVGYDISKQIDLIRNDLHCLGFYNARIKLNGVDVELHHGGGGNAYSLSYKPQKYLENVNPKDQPNVYLLGHFHTAMYMFYRKIHAFMVGSFQGETLLSKRFKLGNTQGGWVVDVSLDDKGGTIINMEFISVI